VGTKNFPWGTLTVNVVGSFIMGVVFVLITEKGLINPAFKPYVMTAFLGAFTTFSTFSLDTFQLIESGQISSAMLYILGSVVLCVLVLVVGIAGARSIF
jgi:CrcB protein